MNILFAAGDGVAVTEGILDVAFDNVTTVEVAKVFAVLDAALEEGPEEVTGG